MNWLNFVISLVAAYLIGSIPFSYIFGKMRGIDLRQHGSGNVGATNALRVLGTKVGVITLLLDMGKGVLAVELARILLSSGAEWQLVIVAIAAISGHIFTIFLGFKGGKGVATSAGVFLDLFPLPCLLALLLFVLIVSITRYVSLGSISAAGFLFIYMLITSIRENFANYPSLAVVSLVAGFIIVRHKVNIQKLLQGTENKISFKKKK